MLQPFSFPHEFSFSKTVCILLCFAQITKVLCCGLNNVDKLCVHIVVVSSFPSPIHLNAVMCDSTDEHNNLNAIKFELETKATDRPQP